MQMLEIALPTWGSAMRCHVGRTPWSSADALVGLLDVGPADVAHALACCVEISGLRIRSGHLDIFVGPALMPASRLFRRLS
jgi:hypothetical protein